MSDWSDLTGSTPDELKRRVDLAAVAAAIGVELESVGGGRYVGTCPFHDDTHPSFAVWWDEENGVQRVGCWSCDFGIGDVFDLVGRVEHLPRFTDRANRVLELSRQGLPAPEPPPPASPPPDFSELMGYAERTAARSDRAIMKLAAARGIVAPSEFLREEFRLGVDSTDTIVYVPHYGRDGKSCAAAKRRKSPDWSDTMAMGGSKLNELYGIWRDKNQPRVILCEGESDTWSVAWWLRDDKDTLVIGIPSGVTKPPRGDWAEQLSNRDVTILFDADDSGRIGVANWVDTLTPVAMSVSVVQLDESDDATSAGEEKTLDAITRRRCVTDVPPGRLTVTDHGYARDSDGAAITDFTLDTVSIIEYDDRDDEEGWQLDVRIDGRVVRIAWDDFQSEARMKKWANRYKRVWFRGNAEAQELMRMLLAETYRVPKLRGFHTAGLSPDRTSFIVPGYTIGKPSWTYIAPVAKMKMKVDYQPNSWDPEVLVHLAHLHRPDIMTPILGWTVAAHVRDEAEEFPILAVTGGAGSGKTTLLGTVLGSFGSLIQESLTNTTPHGLFSLLGSTNAIPVWLDEYRTGARAETKEKFDQAVRDAWTGASAVKGGMTENKQALTELPLTAPIVVSGEEEFQEVSHLERMVVIRMPQEGKNPYALRAVRDRQVNGFVPGLGHDLVTYLMESERVPDLPRETERPAHSRAMARWGWTVLEMFAEEHGIRLPAYDDSRVKEYQEAVLANPPFLQAIRAAIFKPTRDGYMVWIDENQTDIGLRLHPLIQHTKEKTDIKLPGGSGAMKAWLKDRYGAVDVPGWGELMRLPEAAQTIFGGMDVNA